MVFTSSEGSSKEPLGLLNSAMAVKMRSGGNSVGVAGSGKGTCHYQREVWKIIVRTSILPADPEWKFKKVEQRLQLYLLLSGM